MINDLLELIFSRLWLVFVVGLLIMLALILLFGVPDYNPQSIEKACKGINVPSQVAEVYKEEYCLCMGKEMNEQSSNKQQICLARIEKIKENAVIKF